jgi:DMSO/TMAO reductase YedYZ molybdopterin-dependent catalytic subunit
MNDRSKVTEIGGTVSMKGYRLTISGRVASPLELSMDQLRSLDMVETDELMMICGEGNPLGRLGRIKGALLSDIVNLADVIAPEHNDTKKTYLVASGLDGYKTVFAWQELYNTPNGEGVLVALEKDGAPLYEGYGSADLISSMDHLIGPRYVRDIVNIDIRIVT